MNLAQVKMKKCEKIPTCSFFRIVHESELILDVQNGYVQVYCYGPLQDKCYRMTHFDRFGKMPDASISPSGLDFRKFLNL